MCITFFIRNPSSRNDIQFIVAFNRDENTDRETLKLTEYQEDSNIYAGRDLVSSGTWLGLNIKTGIFVLLTNYFLGLGKYRQGKSRGKMVKSFLSTNFIQNMENNEDVSIKIKKDMNEILVNPKEYSAFNLVVYHLFTGKMFYLCTDNGMKQVQELNSGVNYGLCNTELKNLWPKTEHGLKIFSEIIKQLPEKGEPQIFAQLEKLMKDTTKFYEDPEEESSIFIEPYYSVIREAKRKTKSTFFGIFKSNQNKFTANIKQITYNELNGELKEEIVQKKLEI